LSAVRAVQRGGRSGVGAALHPGGAPVRSDRVGAEALRGGGGGDRCHLGAADGGGAGGGVVAGPGGAGGAGGGADGEGGVSGEYRLNWVISVDPVAGLTVVVGGGRKRTLTHYRINWSNWITSARPECQRRSMGAAGAQNLGSPGRQPLKGPLPALA